MKSKALFISLLLLPLVEIHANELRIPHAKSQSHRQFTVRSHINSCQAIFSGTSLAGIIRSANEEFVRRNWSEDFIQSRLVVANQVQSRSKYWYIQGIREDKIDGTLGITYAHYDRKNQSEYLPQERTLSAPPLPRPVDKSGSGFIAELRTLSIPKDLPLSLRNSIFLELYINVVRDVNAKLQQHPELYDQPILHLYADQASLRLYGAMGFKKTHEHPVKHRTEDSYWWDMSISPKNLEAWTTKINQLASFGNFNIPMNFQLINGRNAVLETGSSVNRWKPKNEKILWEHVQNLGSDSEIESGLWGKKGSTANWNKKGILTLAQTSREFMTKEGYLAKADSHLEWHDNGKLANINRLARDTQVGNLVAKKGSDLQFFEDGSLKKIVLKESAQIAPKIFAAKNSVVQWEEPKLIGWVTHVGAEGEVAPGLFAAKGSSISIGYDSVDSKTGLKRTDYYVSKISRPFEEANGTIHPAGSAIHVFFPF